MAERNSFESLGQEEDPTALLEKLRSTIMSTDEANQIAEKIEQQIESGTVTYNDLGISEAEFKRIVREARRSSQDAVDHFSKARFE